MKALQGHPLHRYSDILCLSVVAGWINISCQSKIRYFHISGFINPIKEEVNILLIALTLLEILEVQIDIGKNKCLFCVHLFKQECIPVGCVPPACWPYPVVSHVSRGGGGLLNLLDADPSWMQTPPDADPSWMQSPPRCRPRPPYRQKEWHTLVKIWPCPKLHLRR